MPKYLNNKISEKNIWVVEFSPHKQLVSVKNTKKDKFYFFVDSFKMMKNENKKKIDRVKTKT